MRKCSISKELGGLRVKVRARGVLVTVIRGILGRFLGCRFRVKGLKMFNIQGRF